MRSNLYLKLFISFFKIGAFTFGGGWAMIPLLKEKSWINKTGLNGKILSMHLPLHNHYPEFWR